MWRFIFAGMTAGSAVGFIYLVSRIYKFGFIRRLAGGKKVVGLLLSALIVLVPTVTVYITMGSWNMMVVMVHFLIFWLVSDVIGHFINKIRGSKGKVYVAGIAAIAVSVVYLAVGWYSVHHVFATDYQLNTEKDMGIDKLKIVGITDSHIGTTFHWQDFTEYVEQMNEENPDIAVIVGDYVDDDTSREDMLKCCEALAGLKTRYGVFYAFGNHDKGYYGSEHRGFSAEELRSALISNNVRVLEDECVELTDNLYIIGRQDKSVRSRADMTELMKEFTDEDYVIVLDHQPGDYEAQEAAGPDLVISGHTHGGQFFPLNLIGEWTGANDMTYGLERRSVTDFIVSSGISNWVFQFKTGCVSEYINVTIRGQ